jgi:hypothetical protein
MADDQREEARPLSARIRNAAAGFRRVLGRPREKKNIRKAAGETLGVIGTITGSIPVIGGPVSEACQAAAAVVTP